MTDRSEIRHARRALGAQLARLRKAAGLTQHQLASKIDGYGRSTLANAETGRQSAHRDFWLRCDVALSAGGALIRTYDSIRDLSRTADLDGADVALDAGFRTRTSPSEAVSASTVGPLAVLPLAWPQDRRPGEHSFLTVTRILATQRQAVSPAALLTMIEAHRDTLTTLYARAGDAPVATDIGLLIGETSIVASRLWSAVGNRALAIAHCAYARQIGDRLSHGPARSDRDAASILSATARTFESNLRSDAGSLIGTGGDIALGLRMLDEAAATEHLLPPSARARIAAEQAQTYAVLRLPAECSAALTRAQRAVDNIDAPEPGLFSDWNHARLLVYEGTCHLFLGNPHQAVHVLTQAIGHMQTAASNTNVVLAAQVDLASAYAASGELTQGCHLLADTYTALSALGNRRGLERALGARQRLDPWSNEKAVKELDERIAATTPQRR
jgi:transcriptional regulator with XRE-family HTH domain